MNRKTARENVFILLFEKNMKGDETYEEVFQKATELRGLEYDDYVKQVFFGNMENDRIIEEKIDGSLVGWKKERISNVTQSVLRLATYEMLFMKDVPIKVSINEAIELSKKYDDEKAYIFVNGVLNRISEGISKNE